MSHRTTPGRCRALLGVALGITIAWPAIVAAEPPPPRDWQLSLMAYGWAPKIEADYDGTIAGQDFERTFSTDFGDVFDDWDIGAGAALNFRYKRFVMLLDGVWVQSEEDTRLQGVDLDGYVTNVVGDGKIGFRVLDMPTPWAASPTTIDSPRWAIDLLAGARYWWVRADPLDLEGKIAPPYDVQTDVDWVDPIVGGRLILELIPELYLSVVGDVGGFGIGNGSELTWMVHPMLNWRPLERVSFHAGYKHLRADGRDGPSTGKSMDFELSGPMVGLGFHF